MSLFNTRAHYGALSIGLHWTMALLLVAVYACIELREFFPKGSEPRAALKQWHYLLGLSVFVLAGLRLVLTLLSVRTEILPAPPRWQQRAARLAHLFLYGLMLAMPLLGWALVSAEGHQLTALGFHLPPLMAENKAWAERLEDVHESSGKAGYALLAVHALAALFHHYVLRDNTLARMLPKGFSSSSAP